MATMYKRISDGFRSRISCDYDVEHEPVFRFLLGHREAVFLIRVTKLSRHWLLTQAVLHSVLQDALSQLGIKSIKLMSNPDPNFWGFSTDDALEEALVLDGLDVEFGDLYRFGIVSNEIAPARSDIGVLWHHGPHIRYEMVTGIFEIWRPFLDDPGLSPRRCDPPTFQAVTLPPCQAKTPREYTDYWRSIKGLVESD